MATDVTLHLRPEYTDYNAAVKHKSRQATISYLGVGYYASNEGDVIDAINSQTPPLYGTNFELNRSTSTINLIASLPDSDKTYWDVQVLYRHPESPKDKEEQRKEDSDPNQTSFDISGRTTRVTKSRETVSSHAKEAFDTPKSYDLLIDPDSEGIARGVDILTPSFQWKITRVFADQVIDEAYVRDLATVVGHTNAGSWKGFNKGELLLTGVQGVQREPRKNDGDWEMTFTFEVGLAEKVSIPGWDTVDVGPWEYAWIDYETDYEDDPDEPGTKRAISRAIGIYVERVYDSANYNKLGMGD